MNTINVNGRPVVLDGEGYIEDFNSWKEDVGLALATAEKVDMTEDHWTAVRLMRDHYAKHASIPTARDLARWMKDELGDEKGTNHYLTQLFPNEAMKQASKIAGLPRMPGCT